MKKVLVRGPLLSLSGYGTHSRQVFRWLKSKNNVRIYSQLLPWGITPWMLDSDMESGLVGEIMSTSAPLESPADVSFQIQLPNEWDTSLAAYNVGISAFVETDKCNPSWIADCNRVNHVVVPSNHVKSTIKNTGLVNSPVSVIPEACYDCLLDNSNAKLIDLELSTSFNFLIFGQITGDNPWSDRKNTYCAIKWLCEEFANDPSVGIVVKTNMGTNTTIDRNITTGILTNLINEVRAGPYPKIYLLHGQMSPEEIHGVFLDPKIKALVSATRGEGFGLPILEASVTGLPVLVTDWSGHLDFMNLGKFIKLEYDLVPVHESKIDNQIFMKGSKWAEVREKDFKSKVRKFRKASDKPREWANDLSKKLKKSHSQEAINKYYDELFKDLL